MANTNVVAFKGNLPALNINHFQKALANTKNSVGVTGGGCGLGAFPVLRG